MPAKLNELNDYTMTVEELKENGFHLIKKSLKRGYISRKAYNGNAGLLKDYNGRYGNGFTVERPNFNSTQYCWIEYWIYIG